MKTRVVRADDLDKGLKRRWADIQSANVQLGSPFFNVEFTEAVAAVRRDVFVAVIEDGGEVAGFFPFHRRPLGFGRPIGLGLSDYHGVVACAEADWSVDGLLRSCGLVRWRFDHLVASQALFKPYHRVVDSSPIIDIASGFEAYERSLRELGRSEVRNIRRHIRRVEKDYQTYELIEQDVDASRLERIFVLKSAQCRASGSYDYFSLGWTRELVRYLHGLDSPEFSGVLSSLLIDGHCVAAHFGIRSKRTWHWWFPCYEKAYGRYAPGLILLWEVVRSAAQRGIAYIDLGKDISRYKRSLMTGAIGVASGAVYRSSTWGSLASAVGRVKSVACSDSLRPVLRVPVGAVRRLRARLKY